MTVFSNSWTDDEHQDPVIYQRVSEHRTFDAAVRGLSKYYGTDRAMIFKTVDGRARPVQWVNDGFGPRELSDEEVARRDYDRASCEAALYVQDD